MADKNVVKSRNRKGGHWTYECHWNDMLTEKAPDDKKLSFVTTSVGSRSEDATSKEEDTSEDEEIDESIAKFAKLYVLKCLSCNGGHYTSQCQWKNTMLVGKAPDDEKLSAVTTSVGASSEIGKQGGSKYVPPSFRDVCKKVAKRDDSCYATSIRIANLSDCTTETDLEDLVKPFGLIEKIYLAKDRQTGLCKGLAFVHFKSRNDAAKAISRLNGHCYNRLILSVDWIKPLTNPNQ